MKKTIGTILILAAFPVMTLGATNPSDDHAFLIEVGCKLTALLMLFIGAWLADLFDDQKSDEEKKSDLRLALDDGEYKMPEE